MVDLVVIVVFIISALAIVAIYLVAVFHHFKALDKAVRALGEKHE